MIKLSETEAHMKRFIFVATAIVSFLCLLAPFAHAQSDFFKGKQLTLSAEKLTGGQTGNHYIPLSTTWTLPLNDYGAEQACRDQILRSALRAATD